MAQHWHVLGGTCVCVGTERDTFYFMNPFHLEKNLYVGAGICMVVMKLTTDKHKLIFNTQDASLKIHVDYN